MLIKISLKYLPESPIDNKSAWWICNNQLPETMITMIDHCLTDICQYYIKTFGIRRTKSQNLNVSRLVLQVPI